MIRYRRTDEMVCSLLILDILNAVSLVLHQGFQQLVDEGFMQGTSLRKTTLRLLDLVDVGNELEN